MTYIEPFSDGVELTGIWWGNGEHGYSTDNKNGVYWVKSITVVTVYGQMARVPWARVIDKDNVEHMINLALVEEVILKEPIKEIEDEELTF